MHSRQVLDLYLPDLGHATPLIVWIHGGAFRKGSKIEDCATQASRIKYHIRSTVLQTELDGEFQGNERAIAGLDECLRQLGLDYVDCS